MRHFRKYNTWIDSPNLVIEIYKLSSAFPRKKTYGEVSQFKRAVVSIPTNIAIGLAKKAKNFFQDIWKFRFSMQPKLNS